MQRNCLKSNRLTPALAALLMLAAVAGTGRAGQPDKTDPPKPLPDNIVTAWKEAGARLEWMRAGNDGSFILVGDKNSKPGNLPVFSFSDWQVGRLAKLPAPTSAFGLHLTNTQVKDAGLKELARLKSLQALYLGANQVTDAGLKELAGLTNLQELNLSYNQVTDAGLKELAGLKSLQSLQLYDTQVTDAGLKELAGLKSLKSLNLGRTQATDAGLKELRKALPDCKIIR